MKNVTVIAYDSADTLWVNAAHVPYHTTRTHEKIEYQIKHDAFYEMGNIANIPSDLE